jgi:hypothetical protein
LKASVAAHLSTVKLEEANIQSILFPLLIAFPLLGQVRLGRVGPATPSAVLNSSSLESLWPSEPFTSLEYFTTLSV